MNLKLQGYHHIIAKKLKKKTTCNKCRAEQLFQFNGTACVCAACENVQSVMQPDHHRVISFVTEECRNNGNEHQPL